eukprot:5895269-Pyramimonas_sp.AAC.1
MQSKCIFGCADASPAYGCGLPDGPMGSDQLLHMIEHYNVASLIMFVGSTATSCGFYGCCEPSRGVHATQSVHWIQDVSLMLCSVLPCFAIRRVSCQYFSAIKIPTASLLPAHSWEEERNGMENDLTSQIMRNGRPDMSPGHRHEVSPTYRHEVYDGPGAVNLSPVKLPTQALSKVNPTV